MNGGVTKTNNQLHTMGSKQPVFTFTQIRKLNTLCYMFKPHEIHH